ncbi:MAG UNVERIFIED_CONTAM: hypothetical protein LVQ98_00430 [Rickettsiaceae bacterium]|jgi:hypothetical protein
MAQQTLDQKKLTEVIISGEFKGTTIFANPQLTNRITCYEMGYHRAIL